MSSLYCLAQLFNFPLLITLTIFFGIVTRCGALTPPQPFVAPSMENHLVCSNDNWPDRPLQEWPYAMGPGHYSNDLTRLCAYESTSPTRKSMGCICPFRALGTHSCEEKLADPVMWAMSFLRNWCLKHCVCGPQDQNASGEDGSGDETIRAVRATRAGDTPLLECYGVGDIPDVESDEIQPELGSSISNIIGNSASSSRAGSRAMPVNLDEGAQRYCSLECVGPDYQCGIGCSCHAERTRAHIYGEIGCVSSGFLSGSLSGPDLLKRDKFEGYLVCPCNGTYVSAACCWAEKGMVWEGADKKMGELSLELREEANARSNRRERNPLRRQASGHLQMPPMSSTNEQLSSSSVTKHSAESTPSPPSFKETSNNSSGLTRRVLTDSTTHVPLHHRSLLIPPTCNRGSLPDENIGGYITDSSSYNPSRYADLDELCINSTIREDHLGCWCPTSPQRDYPLCSHRWADPDLYANSRLVDWCQLWCDCGSSPDFDPSELVPVRPWRRRLGLGARRRSRGAEGESMRSLEDYLDLEGATDNDSDHSSGRGDRSCFTRMVRAGLYVPWKCGMFDHLGKRELVKSAVGEVACACNQTYVSEACCRVRDGLVWEGKEMWLGVLGEE